MTESETGWVKAPGTARKDGALEKKGTRLLWNESNPCLSLRAYQRFREERRCFGEERHNVALKRKQPLPLLAGLPAFQRRKAGLL